MVMEGKRLLVCGRVMEECSYKASRQWVVREGSDECLWVVGRGGEEGGGVKCEVGREGRVTCGEGTRQDRKEVSVRKV